MRALVAALIVFLAACASAPDTPSASSEPATITLQNMYWGNVQSSWTLPRGGDGRFVSRDRDVAFDMPAETFDQIREIFRPYEGTPFQCNRVITDGPYGFVIWSSAEGAELHRVQWDAGCVTGDAGDLFARIDQTLEIVAPMRDRAAASP